MLIPFQSLFNKYKLKINGILHIGAHECEEKNDYNNCGIKDNKIIWIEGNPMIAERMAKIVPNVYNALISDKEEVVDFIITNNGQSSSILELETHKNEHPHVFEVSRIKLKTMTIIDFLENNKIDPFFNFINLDIQGAELLALKGMEDLLKNIDYIYSEVNEKYLYKNCGLIGEIDTYLEQFGFKRVEIVMTPHGWGDAFYIKF
jgi:FkbM family methyltransferase